MPLRVAKPAPGPVITWARFVRNAAKAQYITLLAQDDDVVIRLAGAITYVGDINDPDAKKLFWSLSRLFMNKKRKVRWSSAVEMLPASRDLLMRIPACCSAYDAKGVEVKETGKFLVSLDKGNFKLDEVLEVILQVSDVEEFMNFAIPDKPKVHNLHPAKVFSKDMLEQVSKRKRGAFSESATEFAKDLEASGIKEISL
jgi:hypothetical protein